MKTKLSQLRENLSNLPLMIWGIFVMLFMHLIVSWIFVRFVHYEAQYRLLPPSSYNIEIISEQDYTLLGDKKLNKVKLSNGTQVYDRSQAFYDNTMPNYKPLGDQYVLVTTIGTRHIYRQWLDDKIPFVLFTTVGLVLATRNLRKQQASK